MHDCDPFFVGEAEGMSTLTSDVIERSSIDHSDVDYFCLSWYNTDFFPVALTVGLWLVFTDK